MGKIRGKFCWDKRGELERLPLFLIVLVIIAALVIIIVFSWYSLPTAPHLSEIHIYIDGEQLDSSNITEGTHDVYIIAKDNNGENLRGVLIKITGTGINTSKKTDTKGKADFGSLTFEVEGWTSDLVFIRASYKNSFPIDRSIWVIKS